MINRNEDAPQLPCAGVLVDEAASTVRQEQGGKPGLTRQGLGDRALQPAGQAFARMGCQHHQVARVIFQKAEHRVHRVALCDIGLGHPEAEPVRDCGRGCPLLQQAPARERVAHAGKARPVDFVERLGLVGMHDVEVALGGQRQPETVCESAFSARAEVRRLHDAAKRMRHGVAWLAHGLLLRSGEMAGAPARGRDNVP
jgi:hypothetical protein